MYEVNAGIVQIDARFQSAVLLEVVSPGREVDLLSKGTVESQFLAPGPVSQRLQQLLTGRGELSTSCAQLESYLRQAEMDFSDQSSLMVQSMLADMPY